MKQEIENLQSEIIKFKVMHGTQSASNLHSLRISRSTTDDKKKIRDLEQLLEKKHLDLATERRRMLYDFER